MTFYASIFRTEDCTHRTSNHRSWIAITKKSNDRPNDPIKNAKRAMRGYLGEKHVIFDKAKGLFLDGRMNKSTKY